MAIPQQRTEVPQVISSSLGITGEGVWSTGRMELHAGCATNRPWPSPVLSSFTDVGPGQREQIREIVESPVAAGVCVCKPSDGLASRKPCAAAIFTQPISTAAMVAERATTLPLPLLLTARNRLALHDLGLIARDCSRLMRRESDLPLYQAADSSERRATRDETTWCCSVANRPAGGHRSARSRALRRLLHRFESGIAHVRRGSHLVSKPSPLRIRAVRTISATMTKEYC
jgi:hypothetical protein